MLKSCKTQWFPASVMLAHAPRCSRDFGVNGKFRILIYIDSCIYFYSIYLFICLFVCLFIFWFTYLLFIYLFIYLFIHLFIYMYVCMYIYMCVYISYLCVWVWTKHPQAAGHLGSHLWMFIPQGPCFNVAMAHHHV